MKYLKSFILFFFIIWLNAAYPQGSRYVQLASIKFDTPYFDKVEILRDSFPGPGDFHKVNIFNNDKLIFSLDEVLDSAGYAPVELKNLSKSNFFFLFKSDTNYVFMFFGYTYASQPGKMVLVKAARKGFTKIFDHEFGMNEIHRDNNNTLSIIGYPIGSAALLPADNNHFVIVSYAPSLVYQLKDTLKLDSARTIKWNKINYIFRGFSADNDIWVARPLWSAPKRSKHYVFKEKGALPPK